MEDTFQLFVAESVRQAIPQIVSLIIGGLLIPLLISGISFVKSRLSASQLARVQSIVRTLVLAAEQSKFKDSVNEAAALKKQWVLAESQRLLTQQGLGTFASNVPLLVSILEAEVYTQLNSGLALIEASTADYSISPV